MQRNVTFKSHSLKVAGHLYVPDDYKAGERRPAVVTSHPFGGVKEQTASLYARKLSERGFIALAFMEAEIQRFWELTSICIDSML